MSFYHVSEVPGGQVADDPVDPNVESEFFGYMRVWHAMVMRVPVARMVRASVDAALRYGPDDPRVVY